MHVLPSSSIFLEDMFLFGIFTFISSNKFQSSFIWKGFTTAIF